MLGRVLLPPLVCAASAFLLGACETIPPLEPDQWPGPEAPARSSAALAPDLDEAILDDETLPDASLRAAVEQRLRAEPAVDPADVRVRVEDGFVTLSGTTTDLLTRDRVVEETASVRGVRGVLNRLEVEPEERDDDDIAEDVRDALEASPALDGRVLRVRVHDGYVTLEGTLARAAEAEHARTLARAVRGVRDVVDRTAVAARDGAGDDEVQASLERSLALDGRLQGPIAVEVEGGVATLTGSVDSARERDLAAEHALAAGADFVDVRRLEVDGFEDEAPRPGGDVEDDALVEDAVRAALARDPRLDDEAVRVEVRDGVATLRGTVRTLAAKEEATARAREANGVTGVRNLVEVRAAADVADAELSARVEEALARDPWLFESELTVLVEDGVVTLAGELPSRYARARAEALVASIEGVDEVVSEQLDVAATAPPASDEELRAAVREELFWNPDVDPANITVEVEGGVVWLGGEARDLLAAASARESAFLAGARSVVNQIEVPTNPPDLRTTPQAEREYLDREPFFFDTPFEGGDR